MNLEGSGRHMFSLLSGSRSGIAIRENCTVFLDVFSSTVEEMWTELSSLIALGVVITYSQWLAPNPE